MYVLHKLHDIHNPSLPQLDNELFGAMNKISVLRYLAYLHKDDPHVDWFWWLDQDTLFANITHDVPWQRYANADMVLWTPWGADRLLSHADPVGMYQYHASDIQHL